MKKSDFYSINNLLKKKATYSIAIGERSNGKTYSALEYGLKEYQKNGGKIAYIRRWKEDIIGKRGDRLFSALVRDGLIEKYTGGKYTGIKYFAGKQYFCSYDDNGKAIYRDNDNIAYMFSLSDMEHDKSTEYGDVNTIIFDEFIARGAYLPDEFVIFMNVLSTIIRYRDNVKIIMLGNTVNKFCPYFKEMGLSHIKDMKEGSIDVYEYGDCKLRVAVEYTKSLSDKKESNFYFAFNNPKLSMIKSGKWELPLFPHCSVSFKNQDIIFKYFILFDSKVFECDIVDKEDNLFTFVFEKTGDIREGEMIYSLDANEKINYSVNILKPNSKLQEKIARFYRLGKVFYSDNEVGNYIMNYLRECVKL